MIFHQTVAWGATVGLESLVDTMVMRRAWDALPADQRAKECGKFLAAGLACNPYAMTVVEAAFADAPDAKTAKSMLDDFNAALDKAGVPAERALYRDTVRGMVQARFPDDGAPKKATGKKSRAGQR
jgi:hypothetical protein